MKKCQTPKRLEKNAIISYGKIHHANFGGKPLFPATKQHLKLNNS